MPERKKTCSKCFTTKTYSNFYRSPQYKDGRTSHCKSCHVFLYLHRENDPRYRLWNSSRINSHTKGIEHSISVEDVPLPTTCRYLGIVLNYTKARERGRLRSYDAPSIDRINSLRGYVPGNIQVVSDLANRMKQDATIEQLLAFADGVIAAHGGSRTKTR